MTFVSKLLERIVQTQLVNYLTEHDLMPVHQSAYRKLRFSTTCCRRLIRDRSQLFVFST